MASVTRILVAPGDQPAPVLARAAALARLHGAELRHVPAQNARPPFEDVVAAAQEFGADLLVTSASRRSELGPDDWQLIRHSPCALLLVKGTGEGGYRRILVPVDPLHAHDRTAALDDALVTAALALREPSGAELHLLHCHMPSEYVPFRAPGAGPAVFSRRDAMLAAHRDALQQLARRHGIAGSESWLEAGDPREAIPEAARRCGADLVVMGVVARSRLKRLIVGSTAESVLDRLACDVLALKPVAVPA
jgi:universal stress protein E